jgi:hypothetical protein
MRWLLCIHSEGCEGAGLNAPNMARVTLHCVREMHKQLLPFGMLLCTDHENLAWTRTLVNTELPTTILDWLLVG